jgi:hypothetical protein
VRLVADLRRQNALVNAGYHLLRFTVADLRVPGSVVAQVRRARTVLANYPVSPDEATRDLKQIPDSPDYPGIRRWGSRRHQSSGRRGGGTSERRA